MQLYTLALFSTCKPVQHCPNSDPQLQLGFSTMLLVNLPKSLQNTKLEHWHVCNWYGLVWLLSPRLSMHLHTLLWSLGYRSCSAVRGGGTMLFQRRVPILFTLGRPCSLQKQVEQVVLETSREMAVACSLKEHLSQLWTIKDNTALFFNGRHVSICHSEGPISRNKGLQTVKQQPVVGNLSLILTSANCKRDMIC